MSSTLTTAEPSTRPLAWRNVLKGEGCASSTPRAMITAVLGVTGIIFACKLVGFAEKIIVAHFWGTSRSADCYYAAFAVVWSLVFLARELIQPVCLPIYLDLRRRYGPVEGGRLVVAWLLCVGFLAVAAAGILATGSQTVVRLVAPGFSAPAQAETAGLLRVMATGAALLTVMALTRSLLNAHKRFCRAALGEFLFRAVLVGVLAAGFVWRGRPHVGLALAAGAAAGLWIHGSALRRDIVPVRPAWTAPIRTAFGRMMRLAAPLVVGVVCSHVSQVIDAVLASTLSEGRLAALSYARKLTDAVVLMGPAALATVMFSHLASMAAAGRHAEMGELLGRCVRIVLLVAVPVSVAMIMLRLPIVRILFEHGRFGAASTRQTAGGLACYGFGIIAFALDGLLVSTFYALKDMKTPVIVGVVGVAADVVLAWVLMHKLDHLGIALALSISKTAKVGALGVLLRRRLLIPVGPGWFYRITILLLAGLAMAGVMRLVGWAWTASFPTDGGRTAQAAFAMSAACAGGLTFFGVAAAFGLQEVRDAWALVRARGTAGEGSGDA